MTQTVKDNLRPRGRKAALAVTLSATLVAALAVAMPVWAQAGGPTTTHNVQPVQIAGNPSCTSIGSGAAFSFKIDAPADGPFTDLATGVTFNLTIPSVDATPNEGPSFDFSIDGGVAVDVIVKGGPNANVYHFDPQVSSDTWLHAPLGAGPGGSRFFGLSHIEFCYDEAPAEIEILKEAVEDPITVGDHAAFDITVTSVGFATAENVTIDDELPAGLDWEISSEQFNMVDAPGTCTISADLDNFHTVLFCDIGDMDPGDEFTVSIQTVDPIPLGSEFCNTDLDNTAFADADNADQVEWDATIRVQCGAVQINKVVKIPGMETTQPLEDSGWTLFEDHGAPDDGTEVAVNPPGEVTTGADGVACFDGLPTDSDFTARETTTPDGYATAGDVNVSTTGEADCGSVAGDPEATTVENDPLTDISITVTAQVEGATESSIVCWAGEPADLGDSIGGDATDFDDPQQLDIEDQLPGVYTCRIEIDP